MVLRPLSDALLMKDKNNTTEYVKSDEHIKHNSFILLEETKTCKCASKIANK